jgi:hypothetical protein
MKHRDIVAVIRDQLVRNKSGFVARLQLLTMRDSDGCVFWRGAINNCGYGVFSVRFNGMHGQIYAHRLFFVLHTKRNVPSNLVLDHVCGNRNCCNPAHLQAVQQRMNVRRARR